MSSVSRKPRSSEPAVVRKLSLHGLAIEIACESPSLDPTLGRLLGCYSVSDFDAGQRSPAARSFLTSAPMWPGGPSNVIPLHGPGELTEIYVQDERAWIFECDGG